MTLAIVAPITVSKHPNADRLQLGHVLGSQVVVGMDVKDGDVGIFFPEGLQLSEEYAGANDLVRRKDANGNPAGGFFEANRRVRCQKFRGQKSEGYWAPLDSLLEFSRPTEGLKKLAIGARLDSFNGIPLCNKYITTATRSAGQKNRSSSRRETVMFRAHFDTDHLKFNLDKLRSGNRIIVTLKMHGTSQRTGYVKDKIKLPWWKRAVNRFLPVYQTEQWKHLTGSRNVILDRREGTGFHPDKFREEAAQRFHGKLHKGETVYYELVGYQGIGKPIMDRHSTAGLNDKSISARYGESIVYHYGCQDGLYEAYVYRITMTNEDGVSFDLPWDCVKTRCNEMGVMHVPELAISTDYLNGLMHEHGMDHEMIDECVISELDLVNECNDPVGQTHPTEGVCVRIEGTGSPRAHIYKHKSFTFGLLEGYIKERADYVDAEEAA
jgi:hypothetical protein